MLNPETDTTRFINVDKEPFDIYIGGKVARHLEAGEEQIVPVFVAKVGAKHLVDKILQKRHGIADSNRDTPIRKSTLAEIIPDIAQEVHEIPLPKEDFNKSLQEELKRQGEQFGQYTKEKDKEIEELKARLAQLEHKENPLGEEAPKKGRPKKSI